MSKKNFYKGIEAILEPSENLKRDHDKPYQKTTRTTFRIDSEMMNLLKAIAYWERKSTTQVITEALSEFIQSKEESYVKHALKTFKKQSSLKI